MCGRYTLTYTLEELLEMFSIPAQPQRPNIAPNWNVAPTDAMPIARRGRDGAARVTPVRWGLVPYWSKTGPQAAKPLINARAETAAQKPTFRQALARRRALVPANGFYEWTKEGEARQPWFITRTDGHRMVFAGVWERWGEGEARIDSFAILTTTANADIAHLHHRTPIMLTEEAYAAWLDPAHAAGDFLTAPPEGSLQAVRVSRRVNSIRETGPDLVEAVQD